ncbi:RidA family protein [Pandoraea anhela]|uniref:2-aminomuconate deaminase n=1 Tax=Pandoraea anhela TaxID=2508295 RepID=A0A5E4YRR3_9BURK|nr:RidA family protein [Pandoraea anhela]VVE51574.1 2-aminomuconate deaminase [Pandoraea anhela]
MNLDWCTRSTIGTMTLLLLGPVSQASESPNVIRTIAPDSKLPIAQAVEIPAGYSTVYLSGVVPAKTTNAPGRNAYGHDTREQTLNVLQRIAAQLSTLNLSMRDVIKMQVFLVADPNKGDKMDFGGFMDAYRQYFGTAGQPNLPARSLVQVAALASPDFLVEIEVVAVRPLP